MRSRFKPLVALAKISLWGPEPVGLAGARILQKQTAAELNGQMGTIHYGMKGSPYEGSYTGLVASPQTFIGAAQMGAARKVSVQEYPALPAEQAPPALPTWLQDWDSLEGMQ